MITDDLLAAAQGVLPDVVELRRDLHVHPELGNHLPRTQGRVLEALDGLGLEISTGTALRSRVLRVAVSKVRMPRSHRITCWLPPAMMYSAAARRSFTVALMPRFSSTGLSVRPSSLSSSKFCMLRAPTCRASAIRATLATSSTRSTSVTMGRS